MDREMKRVKMRKYYMSPVSPDTAGHGTTGSAKWYGRQLAEFLQAAPRK